MAKYAWDQCIKDMTKEYGDKDTAAKVCAAIKNKTVNQEADIELPDGFDLKAVLKQIETDMGIEPKQEEQAKPNPLESLFEQIRALFQPKPKESTEAERALSSQRLFQQIQIAMEAMQPQPDETGEMPAGAEWVTPLDVYMDNGMMYLVCAKGGKLYRSDVTVANDTVSLGQLNEVTESFPAVQQSISIIRQSDGKARWMATAATAVLNRDGAIDSRKLFDSFIANIQQSKQYPVLDFWHKGEQIRMGQADYVARDDAVYIASGTFDDTELGRAAADGLEKEPSYWGTSISFKPTKAPDMVEVANSVRVPVYSEGVNRFISILPESRAASLFTTIGTQEVQRMEKDIYDALVKLVGEERAKQFADGVDGTNRAIADGKLITRQAAVPDGAAKPDKSDETPLQIEMSEEDMAEIVGRVVSDASLTQMREMVPQLQTLIQNLTSALDGQKQEAKKTIDALTARIADLEKSDEEKRAQWEADLPAKPRVIVTRPSEQHRQKPEDEIEAKSAAEATLASMKTRGKGV